LLDSSELELLDLTDLELELSRDWLDDFSELL